MHDRDRRPDSMNLTALEASLLVLAAYFLASAGGSWLPPLQGSWGLIPWLLRNTFAPLVMLAGAAWVARAHRPLVVVLKPRPGLIGFAIAAGWIGAAGGVWAGAMRPEDLAAGLPESAWLYWSYIWVGAAVPVIEETYFRGVLQAALWQSLGAATHRPRALKALATVAVPAGAFALAHLGSPQVPVLFGMGLGLGALQYWSGSLVVPIIAHAAWNMATVSLAVLPWMGSMALPFALAGLMWLVMALVVHQRSVR